MKRWQILLFVFSVIGLLTVLCAAYPEDGVLGMEFPALADVLGADETPAVPEISPEELMEQRKRAAAEESFSDYSSTDPARFHMPADNPAYFDELYAALDNAMKEPLRIVHYGDSQIEEDRITGTIRRSLQAKFGGYGPGALPARQYYTTSMSVSNSAELERYMIFGNRAGISKYGPFADFVRLDTTSVVGFTQIRKKDKGICYFDRMTVLAGNITGGLSASNSGQRISLDPAQALASAKFVLKDSSTRASLVLSGRADIYGVLLDSEKGVRMDNVPMRGCSGSIFTQMNSAQLRSFYESENVRLIILQYGGNSVPYLKTEKSIDTYVETIGKQIARLHELAPKAKILFIGPSDMATNVGGKMQTYPMLATVIERLKAVVLQNDAAYWDIQAVMGGTNSMVSWVKSNPPLAGPDYVHFTTAGAERIAEVFVDSFLRYYDYYKLRTRR